MPAREECIALATDERYVSQTCVALASYALSNPLNRRDIFVFVHEVSEQGIRIIQTTGKAFGLRLIIKGLDGDWVRSIGQKLTSKIPHVSVATYGKLLIPRFLSQSFKKCLILDSDLLVRGDLDPLFAMDLEGKAIGAAKDGVDASKSASRLGLGDDEVYYNTGVLLIDLDEWKLAKPLFRLPNLIEENQERLIFMEQDILNLLFQGRFKQLDSKWNALMVIVPRGYLRNWEGIPEDQAILHFAGELKPWHEFYQPLMRNLYLGYAQLCPWIKIPKLGPSGAIQKKAALILAKEFGLKDLISKYS
jgi:lipopolysaccharide biosynthesis glycosyltransferase